MTRCCSQLHASDAAGTPHVHGGAGADALASFLTVRSDVLSGQNINSSLSAREKFEIILQRATAIEVGKLQHQHFCAYHGLDTIAYHVSFSGRYCGEADFEAAGRGAARTLRRARSRGWGVSCSRGWV
jgi:hypothetical protein